MICEWLSEYWTWVPFGLVLLLFLIGPGDSHYEN
jgi:hypothetical protein